MRRTLKAGFSLFRIRAAEGLQYRMAALSGATVSTFWAIIEVTILGVFFTYGNNPGGTINGLTLASGVSYIWVGQFLTMLQIPGVDGDLIGKIVSGDIGIELCRPLDLYWHWYARTAAGKVNSFIMRGGMVIVCGVVISLLGFTNTGLGLPYSPLHFILFLISIGGAFLFSASFSMFITAIRIGIAWGDGPLNLIVLTSMLLSGGYFPLQLWPDFMQTFLRFQPFASYLDTPARIYVGSISIENVLISMVLQLVWITAFIIFGRIIMKHKLKSVVVQGG